MSPATGGPQAEPATVAGGGGLDEAVDAARRVVSALLLAGDGTQARMAEVTERLEEVASHLEHHAPARRQRLVDMWAGQGVPRHDPVTGAQNALSPPLHLSGDEDGSVSGSVRLGLPYQGPPGAVHGGISALMLDHTLGVANAWAGHTGMTGTLRLRYRHPVPLFEELRVSGRLTGVEGRKIHAEGTIARGDRVLVWAEGLFIAPRSGAEPTGFR